MIFEDEPKPFVQEVWVQQNTSLVSQIVSFGADTSFILHSLQRMKTNAVCEIRKKLLDGFIAEFLAHSSGFLENQGFDTFSENYKISPVYSKQSFDKVMREQEYLDRIMSSLNTD